ncbi:uncharacterized protein [Nicotiana tomentosiformis]|uniref:uncharacterized protein n=1 Tax=Nicotiana tomentosiformis TaxID=4098 RepID=UPI00388CB605
MAPYKALYERMKSYADKKVRDVAFIESEKVLLRVSPMKGVMRFGKNGKLSPWYICPLKSHVLDCNLVQLDENLAYEEEPVSILDRQVQKLRSKDIASVKV